MVNTNKPGKVRVGVIGTGWVSTVRHIPAFRLDRRATISAVMDRNLSRAESVAKKFKIPRSFDLLEDFLREPLDVVSICTPPPTHAAIIKEVLLSGKHVLVEKPMTLRSQEGKQLEEIASKMGVLLCPAHSFLFSRSAQQADSLLRKGETGEIQWAMGIQISSWNRRLPTWFDELPGGLFFDEAPHVLYLMQHFLGDARIEQSWHTGGHGDSQPKTERVEFRLKGSLGAGYVTMWTGAPFSEWCFVLFCSRSVLILDLFRDILINLPPERAHGSQDVLKASLSGTGQFWGGIAASSMRLVRRKLLFGHDLLVKRFLDAVISGGESPVSPRMGWKVIELIEDILSNAPERA